jgi:Tol biopolymer transport system component
VTGHIAFVRDGWIYVIDADGANERRLRQGALPRWSPDGQFIAFSEDDPARPGHRIVAIVSADGATYRELHPDPSLDFDTPAWSPDGKWLALEAFSSEGDSPADGIYLVRAADGGGLKRIWARQLPGGFSPDGRHLAFADNDSTPGDLVEISTDGLQTSRVITNTGPAKVFPESILEPPGYMPDGQAIYVSFDGTIVTFALDGREIGRFAVGHDFLERPRLSPDGKYFVVHLVHAASGAGCCVSDLSRINVDGSGLIRLADAGEDPMPDWGR